MSKKPLSGTAWMVIASGSAAAITVVVGLVTVVIAMQFVVSLRSGGPVMMGAGPGELVDPLGVLAQGVGLVVLIPFALVTGALLVTALIGCVILVKRRVEKGPEEEARAAPRPVEPVHAFVPAKLEDLRRDGGRG